MPGNSSNIRAGGAYVELSGDDKKLKSVLDRAAARFKAIGATVSAVGREMFKVGLAIVAPIVAATKAYEAMGTNLYRAAQRTGTTVEAMSALSYAARQSNVEVEDLEIGMRKMQKTIGDAALGSKDAATNLALLGLSAADLRKLSPDQQLQKMADAFQQIQDPALRADLAIKIFGRSGTQLLPLLQQGSAGIEQFEKRAKALGIVMGADAAEGAARLHERLEDLTDVLKNGVFRVGEAVSPIFIRLTERVTLAAMAANEWISAHQGLIQTALNAGRSVVAAGAAFFVLGKGISLVGTLLPGIGSAFSVVRAVAGVIAPVFAGMIGPVTLVTAAIAGLAAYFLYTTEVGRAVVGALGGYFDELKDTATTAIGGVTDALEAGDWKLAAEVAWAGLKVAWDKGIAPLKTAWNDLTWGLKSAFVIAVFAIEDVWEEVRHGLETGWSETVAFVGDLWDGFTDTMLSAWEAVRDTLKKGWNDIKSTFSSDFDSKTANAAIDDATDKARTDRDKQITDAARDREQKRLKEQQDEQARHNKKITDLEKGKATALGAINDEANKKDKDNASALANAEAALAAKRNQAAKERHEHETKLPPLPDLKRPGLDDDGLNDITQRIKAVGTFSARGAGGLGQSGFAQRQTKAAEQAVKLLESIEKKVGFPSFT